jgi:hypothetical protein
MRFSLKQTSARAFDFSLPDREGRARQLGFENITELGGAIEITPQAILLQEAAARLLQITAVEWRTRSGLIAIGAPVSVMDVFVDGRIPRGHAASMPLDGRATVKRLSTDSLVVEGFGPRISVGLRMERIDVAQREPAGTASIESVAISELETSAGDFLVRLREAAAAGLQARWPVARPDEDEQASAAGEGGSADGGMEIAVASITGTGLAMRSRAIEIQAENIDVREAAMRGRAFSLAAVSVGKLSLELDLAALRAASLSSTGATEHAEHADEHVDRGGAAAVRAPRRRSIRSQIDWRFLDRVDGQIDVDVTVDAHLPVIRRRRATHYFRVPIEKGIFNYRQLENGLSSLENAVIDFDLRGQKLVIERDLPIIRMRKNLVEWHLDEEEMALARQRKVKLRTLPRFEIKSGNGKNSDVKLHGIEIRPINIDLSVAPPAALEAAPGAATRAAPEATSEAATRAAPEAMTAAEAGATGQSADARAPEGAAAARSEQAASAQEYGGILPELVLRRLMITGSLDYPEGEGALTLKVKQLAAALRGLPLGGFVVDVGAVRVESIEPIKIVFDGLRPRAISLTLNGLTLERVTVTPAPADDASASEVEDAAAEDGADVESAPRVGPRVGDDAESASASAPAAGAPLAGDRASPADAGAAGDSGDQ